MLVYPESFFGMATAWKKRSDMFITPTALKHSQPKEPHASQRCVDFMNLSLKTLSSRKCQRCGLLINVNCISEAHCHETPTLGFCWNKPIAMARQCNCQTCADMPCLMLDQIKTLSPTSSNLRSPIAWQAQKR